ncbi:hypothetical protein M406DRAFT_285367 [Cryphonectria parasitica EP155]|uniref:Uncharacterized protein n=1 Tax=Cryphonectria parasitica (strain ATCC 38755 / EP155) TaxID=660469 RepID=A0A9P4YC49_CRYP1|nr:uncharacterized protein M406DRAFT_285367 [Cryphonectria parasitica EP155]KAF3770623.1 hypothetical protein M406DRAFT_285367 [Cryphonectria parasitica EP155]
MPRTTRNQPEPSRRDSWPPTQISLYQSIEDEGNDTKMAARHRESLAVDDDPINSFLTPTPLLEDGDTDDDIMDMDMDMDMAFDAGIEDPQRPSPAVRSISPSKLTGGLRPPPSPRTPTPPHYLRSGSRSPPSRNSPEIATPSTDMGGADNDYDDGEDYVRLTPQGFTLAAPPLTLRSFISHGNKARNRPKMAPATRGRSMTSLGRPAPTPLSRLPNRPRSWSGANDNMYHGSGGRLSPRAWREPSPDVWSIEEDAEGEVLSEMEGEVDAPDYVRRTAKAGKRVRFAAMREEIP